MEVIFDHNMQNVVAIQAIIAFTPTRDVKQEPLRVAPTLPSLSPRMRVEFILNPD